MAGVKRWFVDKIGERGIGTRLSQLKHPGFLLSWLSVLITVLLVERKQNGEIATEKRFSRIRHF
jgi:hypothetical protein